jgi:hypothetical protein
MVTCIYAGTYMGFRGFIKILNNGNGMHSSVHAVCMGIVSPNMFPRSLDNPVHFLQRLNLSPA